MSGGPVRDLLVMFACLSLGVATLWFTARLLDLGDCVTCGRLTTPWTFQCRSCGRQIKEQP